jgi:hypothetical protein
MVRIRAFRAVDDYDSCMRFANGHKHVLASYGIKQVTSSNMSWLTNPNVYVIVVEAPDEDRILGGTRIHVASQQQPLPFVEALAVMDERIVNMVHNYSESGTGELCGLWTDRTSTGQGYSILLTDAGVAEAGIALAHQLQLRSLFVLCAPWTVKMAENAGFKIEESVGDKGKFPYPKPDLLATLLVIPDNEKLDTALPTERERIYDLRKNPRQTKIEPGPKGQLEIEYDLLTNKKK